jgi:MFS family permease
MIAAASNSISLIDLSSFSILLSSRFSTGFFLAGIYPVGMKIASDWSEKGLGLWLGALVGALVLGTAFPQVLRIEPELINPTALTLIVSLLSVLGGILVLTIIKDGPFRKPAIRFSFGEVSRVYKNTSLRNAAFGYFGHMWELYAFWAFVPWLLHAVTQSPVTKLNTALWSFIIIGAGFIGCLIGGFLSRRFGSKTVALLSLILSGTCCLLSPLIIELPMVLFLLILIIWGITVVADSPQLSALVAQSASPEIRGSAITLTTCVGFGITIGSIQLLNYLQNIIPSNYLMLLLMPGPVFGVVYLLKPINISNSK